jgi:hypothetical protein
MMNVLKSRWLVLPLLILSASFAFAQATNGTPPSGTLTFSFDTDSPPVFDLSGSYTLDQVTEEGIDLNFGIDVTQSVSGMITGSGQTIVNYSSSAPVAANYKVKGKISGGGAHPTRVTLSVHLTGHDTVLGQDSTFNITLQYDLTIDPAALTLTGTSKGHANFSHLGSNRIKTTVTPIGLASGTWSLQMTLGPFGNKLKGTGVITLADSRTLQMRLTGTYSPESDLSKVKLTGFGDSRGTTVKIEFTSAGLVGLNGKILNQTVTE